MKMTPSDAASLQPFLSSAKPALPKSGRWEPYYDATTWDFDDLMRCFREDIVRSGPEIWTACEAFIQSRRWPRLKVQHAFWLRERWEMAQRYCNQVGQDRQDEAISKTSPDLTASSPALRHVVIDLWDERLVDFWLRENARQYVHHEDYSHSDGVVDFEMAMRRFENNE